MMGDYDPHINIEPVTQARDGQYMVKEVEIEHSPIGILETPLKIVDANNVNENLANFVKEDMNTPIFENWKFINQLKSFNKLYEIIEEPEEDQIRSLDKFFNLRKKVLDQSFTTLSLSFQRNPFESHKFSKGSSNPISSDGYNFLLDYLHSASSAFVLVPDINMDESFKINDYLLYIDESVNILSDFNNKPIFVPVPIKLNKNEFEKILKHYKYQGYTNLWVNFQASQISSTQFTRLRYLMRNVEKQIHLERSTLYFSHIRKEVNRHPLDIKTVASNAIAPFVGCDFLGISREPPVGGGTNKSDADYVEMYGLNDVNELKHMRLLNRNRLFDPETYYYYNIENYPHKLSLPEKLLMNDDFNRIINCKILDSEINLSKNYVKDNKSINGYVKQKKAFTEDKELSNSIIRPDSKEQSNLLEFIKNR